MNNKPRKLRALFVASEAEPFYKVGGLGDYAGSLPRAIHDHFVNQDRSVDMRVALPLHDPATIEKYGLEKIGNIKIAGTSLNNKCTIFFGTFNDIPHYFIKQEIPQPESISVYGKDQHKAAIKYAIFSLSVFELFIKINWTPHIIHTNDWHTALVNHQNRTDKYKTLGIKTLLTIHNMPFMGYGSEPIYKELNIKGVNEPTFPSWAQNLPLPMGISTADKIVAVSPTYAEELKTSFFAYGLEDYFLSHQEKLTGIINGIDFSMWDPQHDPIIDQTFSSEELTLREHNKKVLYKEIGFTYDRAEPLLIVISRLESQKGIDLILDMLAETADGKWKAFILGSGHHGYEHAFQALERVFPKKIKAVLEYNPNLARKLYASGDMILMPSLYEPCGLSQMIAMRYGCVPIAHAVGGLKDSIRTLPASKRSGFLFKSPTKEAFIKCVSKALESFDAPDKWAAIQMNGMKTDFSWDKSAKSYADLYLNLVSRD